FLEDAATAAASRHIAFRSTAVRPTAVRHFHPFWWLRHLATWHSASRHFHALWKSRHLCASFGVGLHAASAHHSGERHVEVPRQDRELLLRRVVPEVIVVAGTVHGVVVGQDFLGG